MIRPIRVKLQFLFRLCEYSSTDLDLTHCGRRIVPKYCELQSLSAARSHVANQETYFIGEMQSVQ